MSRRFQFSLRALLVVILVVAAFFEGKHWGEYREREKLAAAQAKVEQDQEDIYIALKWMHHEGLSKGLDMDWLNLPEIINKQVDDVFERSREKSRPGSNLMPRPQFSIRALFWLTLVVAAFLAGSQFERERRSREEFDRDHDYSGPPSNVWIDMSPGSRP